MPTAVLRPLAVGSLDQWVLGAGASKVVAVDSSDPVSHDDDTSYISDSEVNHYQTFTLTAIPSVGQVNTVKVGSRMKSNGGAGESGENYVRLSGSNTAGTSFTFSGAYVTQAATTVARPGGGSYTPADLSSLEMGVRFSCGVSASCRVTTIWIDLDYETPGGLIPFFLDCVIGGLSYPFLQDFARHVSFASAASATPVVGPAWTVRPDEVVKFWGLHKARRNPRFFDLGK